MAPTNIPIQEIPTLTYLYHTKKLPEPDERSRYTPDAKLNERVSIWRGNIVHLESDMIVNAANKSLRGGGGVDGAIHRAAGPELLEECKKLGGADVGQTKVTKGYDLPAKRIAHTVGPIYTLLPREKAAEKLKSCYQTSLELCAKHGGGSIGFSSISTGVYSYPIVDATRVALETARRFLEKDQSVTRVIYVVFSEKDERVYRSLASEYFPAPDARASAPASEEEAKEPAQAEDDEENIPFPPSSQATVVGQSEEDDKAGLTADIDPPSSKSTGSAKTVVSDTQGANGKGNEAGGEAETQAATPSGAEVEETGTNSAVEEEGSKSAKQSKEVSNEESEPTTTGVSEGKANTSEDAKATGEDDDEEWIDVKKPSKAD